MAGTWTDKNTVVEKPESRDRPNRHIHPLRQNGNRYNTIPSTPVPNIT